MKKFLSLALLLALIPAVAFGQMFTASPGPVQETTPDVVVTFHADRSGVDAFTDQPESTAIYAHIGVLTTKSPSSWSHVQSTWGKADEAFRFVYQSANVYTLNLGDLREYFKITDADEHITALCLIARNAGGTVQTSDQFLTLAPEGFQIELLSDLPSDLILGAKDVNFTVNATESADIKVDVDGTVIATGSGKTLAAAYTISTSGQIIVTATATSATGEERTASLSLHMMPSSAQVDYPGGTPRMGTVTNADGSVTFCFGAPLKQTVILMPSWDGYQPCEKNVMNYQDYEGYRYFWITVDGLDASTPYPYYFWVDGRYKVGDPYANLILDPYADRSIRAGVWDDRPAYPTELSDIVLGVYQGDLDDYNWQCTDFEIPAHDSLVIYEMLLRDFTGKNKMADGTVRAAIEKIPYLKELGVNAVELMPIMEFNGNNSWGYNPNFYMAPDKSYGSPADYKEFVDECHKNGIAVILDVAFNHSDGLHPWYQMYSIDASPFYNQEAPHGFSVLNDWKQENPLVQQQWHDALRYWLSAYNVDGFRFDLVKGLAEKYPNGDGAYNSTRVKVVKGLQAAIKEVKPDGIHINEAFIDNSEEKVYGAAGQMNWSNVSGNSQNYAMGKTGTEGNLALTGFKSSNWSLPIGTAVSYAESHDEERMGYQQTKNGVSGVKGVHEVSMKRLGSVAAQMLMTPGAKMIWQFGELGADETTKKSNGDNNTNPKKVVWDYLDDPDRAGLHDTYAALNQIRLANPEMFGKDATCNHKSFTNTLNPRAIVLKTDEKEIVTIINPKIDAVATYSVAVSLIDEEFQTLTATPGFEPAATYADGKLTCEIPANSFAVFATKNVSVSGIDSVMSDASAPTAKAYVVDGCIRIAGTYRRATACNLSGRAAAIGSPLPAGIYIVNIDGHASKLVVK